MTLNCHVGLMLLMYTVLIWCRLSSLDAAFLGHALYIQQAVSHLTCALDDTGDMND